MWKSIFGTVGKILGIGSEYIKGKQDLKKVEIEGKIAVTKAKSDAEVKLIEKSVDADNSLDKMAQEDMKTSLKDEYLMILFTFPVLMACVSPFVMCFYLGDWSKLLDQTIVAFQSLDLLPTWLKWCIVGIFIVTYGLRNLTREILKRKKIL